MTARLTPRPLHLDQLLARQELGRGDYGHVAWVSGIDGEDLIIEEYNCPNNEAFSARRVHKSYVEYFIALI